MNYTLADEIWDLLDIILTDPTARSIAAMNVIEILEKHGCKDIHRSKVWKEAGY